MDENSLQIEDRTKRLPENGLGRSPIDDGNIFIRVLAIPLAAGFGAMVADLLIAAFAPARSHNVFLAFGLTAGLGIAWKSMVELRQWAQRRR